MTQRFFSLDVFRGATVALMILVNNPGSGSHVFTPLDHAEWQGCTPTDLVFPFFLFAVGNAMAFVLPKFADKGNAFFWNKVLKRSFLIFIIGLFLSWCPFFIWVDDHLVFKQWAFFSKDENGVLYETGVRILGVLQRIAICYLVASVVAYYLKPKSVIIFSIGTLLLYWAICWFGGTGSNPYTLETFFANKIDYTLIGKHHLLSVDRVNNHVFHFDYEGLASSVAAVVQVLIGYLVGYYILLKGKTYEMLTNLFVLGSLFLLAGYWWDMIYPISKKMWTSSYTIYTSGLAVLCLCVLMYLIEFKNVKGGWARFCDVFGKNALFIFVLSGFLPRICRLIRINDHLNEMGKPVFYNPLQWFYEHVCKNVASDLRIGSLLFAVTLILLYWFVGYLLDKKKIYIKV